MALSQIAKIFFIIFASIISINSFGELERTKVDNSENFHVSLKFEDIWSRAPILPNNNIAVYMKINNLSEREYVIIGVDADETANNAELHKSYVDENGISRMTMVDKIVVPANSKIEFAPGGLHIMLMDLKKSLKIGDKVIVTLKLEDLNPIDLEVLIK